MSLLAVAINAVYYKPEGAAIWFRTISSCLSVWDRCSDLLHTSPASQQPKAYKTINKTGIVYLKRALILREYSNCREFNEVLL